MDDRPQQVDGANEVPPIEIDGVIAGDEESWRTLFRILKPYVHGSTRNLVDPSQREDVTQQAMIAVWHYIARGWRPENVDDVVRRAIAIAKNKARDRYKREQRERSVEDIELVRESVEERLEGSAGGLDLGAVSEAFDACLEILPDQQREPLRLRLLEELTFEQIAARLGVGSLDTVYARYNTGRKFLQRCLEGKGFGREFFSE